MEKNWKTPLEMALHRSSVAGATPSDGYFSHLLEAVLVTACSSVETLARAR